MSFPPITFPPNWLDFLTNPTHHHATDAAVADLFGQLGEKILAIEAAVAARETAGARVFPLPEARYAALQRLAPEAVRVVIVGQDPYHGMVKLPDGQQVPEAMGLSFSVPQGARLPPSLRNIFKELVDDLAVPMPTHGDLSAWANQGVLLLNTVLTVEQGQAKSHDALGWQTVTSAILAALSRHNPHIIFVLWGKSAQALQPLLHANSPVLMSSHPSPIGGTCYKGFFGSRPFSKVNALLAQAGQASIRW